MFITGTGNYFEDISHWASSSTQIAACSFEPGTLEDIGIAVSMRYEMYCLFFTENDTSSCAFLAKHTHPLRFVSFGSGNFGSLNVSLQVKGGGHATNPGFSSTTGVQISMSRFSEVVYDAAAQTVTIGAGLIWDDVYAALEPHGVNVVGGRVSGVGVAGFTLGGGMFETACTSKRYYFERYQQAIHGLQINMV